MAQERAPGPECDFAFFSDEEIAHVSKAIRVVARNEDVPSIHVDVGKAKIVLLQSVGCKEQR